AVYTRNLRMSDDFGVTVKQYGVSSVADTVKKSISAGDTAFNAIISTFWDAAALSADGYLAMLTDIDELNLGGEWWDQCSIRDLSINNRLFFAVNDISILAAEATVDVWLFNKDMLTSLGLEDPYSLVENDQWNYSKMMDMMKGAAYDADGNGKMDTNDVWGFANNSEGVINSVFVAAGQNYIQKDENDIPYLAINNERALNALSTTVDLMYKNPDSINKVSDMDEIFSSGRSLFHVQCLQIVKRFRSMEIDFGILPNPKYDEYETDYHQGMHPIGGAFSLPSTLAGEELAKSAEISDILAHVSSETLIPAYYEVNLTNKLLRDDKSSAMLDIILTNRSYDLMRPFNWGGLTDKINALVTRGERSFVSVYEANADKVNDAIAKTVEQFK
ncbi:MAG: hypothetical protein WCQ72_03495, partial [Eubacteriales bacterium]